MQILKAINNNVVSCMDAAGQELVVMGRGLGFNARPGEAPDPAKIEKIFRMENQQETDRLKHLLANLPPEQIELCTRIIAYATETLNKRLNENVYLTLTDHVCFAISRKQQGACFENELLPEVPLYANVYVTMYPDWLEGYEQDSFWDFQQAILYCTVAE